MSGWAADVYVRLGTRCICQVGHQMYMSGWAPDVYVRLGTRCICQVGHQMYMSGWAPDVYVRLGNRCIGQVGQHMYVRLYMSGWAPDVCQVGHQMYVRLGNRCICQVGQQMYMSGLLTRKTVTLAAAPALQHARDTPRIALAPSVPTNTSEHNINTKEDTACVS